MQILCGVHNHVCSSIYLSIKDHSTIILSMPPWARGSILRVPITHYRALADTVQEFTYVKLRLLLGPFGGQESSCCLTRLLKYAHGCPLGYDSVGLWSVLCIVQHIILMLEYIYIKRTAHYYMKRRNFKKENLLNSTQDRWLGYDRFST
jgi:hypothetical protein